MSRIHVAAAVIVNSENEVFLARRPNEKHQGGLWEFPGGKLEPGEGVLQGLKRELLEELAIDLLSARPLIQIAHDYSDKQVLLDVWLVSDWIGKPVGNEGQETSWVALDELSGYNFPAANLPIIRAAQLPDTYLITPSVEKQGEQAFLKRAEACLGEGISMLRLRNSMICPLENYLVLARKLAVLCEKYHSRFLIDGYLAIAADHVGEKIPPGWGLHFSSKDISLIGEGFSNRLIAASCHNEDEIVQAENAGVDFITLSPVLLTDSHPGSRPLDWQGFAALARQSTVPVYALGGLGPDDRNVAFGRGAQGIAGISQIWNRDK